MAKTNASFGRPVAFSSAVIGRTSGSFPLIMPHFCCKVFDFSLKLKLKCVFLLFFKSGILQSAPNSLFKVCFLNIFELECTLPEKKKKKENM